MKKIVLLSVLALTASLCAEDDLVAAAQKMNGQSKQNMKKKEAQQKKEKQQKEMDVVTLTSARPESDNGWYLFADALYWKADVGSTDWANEVNSSTNKAKNHSLNYNWDWGFKAGIGVNMDHDMWDSNLMYTWFFTNQSDHIKEGQNITVTDQIGFASSFSPTSGSTKWDLHFSMFDWELGRWHYVSKNLALRPHVGVKGGWIHQKIHSTFGISSTNAFSTASSIDEKFENNFWGVGPSVGVNTQWVFTNAGQLMDHRFSLFGDFGGALMYGHFTLHDKQLAFSSTGGVAQELLQTGLNRNLATTMLQGILGFSWDTSFNRGRNHFMLKVGYELQYWFRQNQLVQLSSSSGRSSNSGGFNNTRFSDDLALQGVTGEIRFDF